MSVSLNFFGSCISAARTIFMFCTVSTPRGGGPLGFGRQLPPQLTVGWRPLAGGGLGGGEGWEGRRGGRFPGGGGGGFGHLRTVGYAA